MLFASVRMSPHIIGTANPSQRTNIFEDAARGEGLLN